MTLTQERKQEIVSQYQLHATDTGSSDLQVAMLTDRINRLSEHLKTNKSDHSSRRGLLKMIGQRKRLLAFIQAESVQRYQNLADRLGIRRVKD
jgi:small subunit ribosomal protein S15